MPDAAWSVKSIAEWIASTGASQALGQNLWVVPTSQSVHIIGIALVFCGALIISLQLLGVRRFAALPTELHGSGGLMYAGLWALLITGTVQIIAEPVRQFVAPVFWIKMFLLLANVLMLHLLSRRIRLDPLGWGNRGNRIVSKRIYAVLSLVMWIAIIFCGRFIGYTWMNYA